MIRILLVDDHAIIRDGIRALLADEPDLLVVGQAANGIELLAELATTPADVILMDVNMPGMDGQEATQRVRAQFPEARVLALSMLDHEQYVARMMDAGAYGYVLKNAGKDEILYGIRTVAKGRPFLCSELGMTLLRKLQAVTAGTPTNGSEAENNAVSKKPGNLSKRETEVLGLMAEGLTTKEMADKLFTSTRTVETHRQNILEKTQTKNTAALIRWAMTEGLIE